MSLLSIGASALNAAYAQIQTTGNNIANANTTGYHRQTVTQAEVGYQSGQGFTGMGVDVQTVQRSYNTFLEQTVSASTSAAASDAARNTQMNALQNLFSDPTTGLNSAMGSLQSSLANLVSTPGDASARTAALGSAKALATQISSTSSQLDQLGTDTDQQIASDASQLNSMLQQVARLNSQIASNGSWTGQQPNALMDQRDSVVNQINGLIGTTSQIDSNGSLSLYTTGGLSLVLGDQASTVSVGNDPLGSGNPQLQVQMTAGGAKTTLDSSTLGGEIGGLMSFRLNDLQAAKTQLGQMAAGLAQSFNQVQANGVTTNGTAGQPLFVTGAPVVTSSSSNTGTGQMSVSVADGSKVQASDYKVSYDGSNFMITRMADGQQSSLGGLPATIDGLTFNITGAPQAGDQFMVQSASQFAHGFSVGLSSGSQLATALPMTPAAGSGNQGSLSVGSFAITSSTNANLSQPVTLTFDGNGNFSVSGTGTGNPTSVPYVAGQPIQYNGWSLTLSGSPAAGDTYTIAPNTAASSDNRNAQAMLAAVSAGSVDGSSFTDAYANLVADVGSRAQDASNSSTASTAALSNATSALGSSSGVNLDEEATHLIQYQQAYQAAAKIISTSQTLFDSLMSAVNN